MKRLPWEPFLINKTLRIVYGVHIKIKQYFCALCRIMKYLACLLLFFFTFEDYELAAVRQGYIDAAVSERDADAFYKRFETIADASPTLMAYKAASIVLLAKYESGLFTKTRLFNRGTNLLESVIKKAPDNYEARLIRLNIQDNVPWITGYTSDIKKDKAFLIRHYNLQDNGLKLFVKQYAAKSGAFTPAERRALE